MRCVRCSSHFIWTEAAPDGCTEFGCVLCGHRWWREPAAPPDPPPIRIRVARPSEPLTPMERAARAVLDQQIEELLLQNVRPVEVARRLRCSYDPDVRRVIAKLRRRRQARERSLAQVR